MSQKTLEFPVEGMNCQKCVGRVTGALNATPGVIKAAVRLKPPAATVDFDDAITSPSLLAAAVADAGYAIKLPGN